MFKFEFSNTKTTSRDTSPYPILLADVKAKSFYFIDNSSDTSLDNYINDLIIPSVVKDWEDETGYILLDSVIRAFVPSLEFVSSDRLKISLKHTNIRSVSSLNYYNFDWNLSDAKETITDYILTEELIDIPSGVMLNDTILPLNLYPIENNLEITYLAGFSGNTFTNLDPDIKNCLAMQAALAIDVKQGYCDNYYTPLIEKVYQNYTIKTSAISIL
jgi:hypothetical protein